MLIRSIKGNLRASKYFRFISNFVSEQRGQALTEYALLISVIVVIVLTVGFVFSKKIRELFEGKVNRYLTQQFFSPGRMYQFKIPVSR